MNTLLSTMTRYYRRPHLNRSRIDTSRRFVRPVLEGLEDRLVLSGDPGLSYNGGPLLSNVEVTAVFWGQDYQTAAGFTLVDTPQQQQVGQLSSFLQYLVQSPYMDLLSQYSVHGSPASSSGGGNSFFSQLENAFNGTVDYTDNRYTDITIGKGSFLGSDVVAGPGSPMDNTQVTTASMEDMIAQQIDAGKIHPDANTLVIVFTPPTVTINKGGDLYPTKFGGHHDSFYYDPTVAGHVTTTPTSTSILVPYAFIPDPNTGDTTTDFNDMTSLTSHELAEAVTDPDGGDGWTAANSQAVDPTLSKEDNEIGDLVENRSNARCILGGYTVQGLFSLSQYNNTNQTDGLAYPVGAVPATGDLLLTDAPPLPPVRNYPPVTTSSNIPLTDTTLQVTSTRNPDGSISGKFSGYAGSSSSHSGTVTIQDQQGAALYTLSSKVDLGYITGTFNITPVGAALGYGQPNSPLVSLPTGLTAVSPNNSGTSPTFSGTLATFADTSPGDTASINWGDGTTSAATIVADPSLPGQYDVVGTHTFAAGSVGATHDVSVTITNPNGSSTFQTTITNAVAPLKWTTGSVQVSAGSAVQNAVVGSFVDSVGADPTSSYTATIDWGDGTAPSQGTVTYDGKEFLVQGSHNYTQFGIYTLGISVQDADGSQTSFASTATVTPIATTTVLTASPLSSTAGQPVTLMASVQTNGPGVPAGSVTFLDGQTVLGSANLDATGKALFITTSLSPGEHSIKAIYSGNNIFQDSITSATTLSVSVPPGEGGGGITPVGPLMLFGFGFGPNGQLDLFEVDQQGEVFALAFTFANFLNPNAANAQLVNTDMVMQNMSFTQAGGFPALLGSLEGSNHQSMLMMTVPIELMSNTALLDVIHAWQAAGA